MVLLALWCTSHSSSCEDAGRALKTVLHEAVVVAVFAEGTLITASVVIELLLSVVVAVHEVVALHVHTEHQLGTRLSALTLCCQHYVFALAR